MFEIKAQKYFIFILSNFKVVNYDFLNDHQRH